MTAPPAASATHLVLIPSYNTGARVLDTVRRARLAWSPVWVVVDGSTDGTGAALIEAAGRDPGLHVLVLRRNQGKGAAVLAGLDAAAAAGFTHVLAMDADGQHPADHIEPFHAGVAPGAGGNGARPAGVRSGCAGATGLWTAPVELVRRHRDRPRRHR